VRMVLASWDTGPRISTPATGDTTIPSAHFYLMSELTFSLLSGGLDVVG
jgi:hypothetical protein